MSGGAEFFMLADRLERIEAQLGRLLEDHSNVTSMWLTKKELAQSLGVSARYIEERLPEGLPHRRIASKTLFRLQEVEAWLKERSYLREVS